MTNALVYHTERVNDVCLSGRRRHDAIRLSGAKSSKSDVVGIVGGSFNVVLGADGDDNDDGYRKSAGHSNGYIRWKPRPTFLYAVEVKMQLIFIQPMNQSDYI